MLTLSGAWSTGTEPINVGKGSSLAVMVGVSTVLLTAFALKYLHAVIAWLQAGRVLRKHFPSPPVDNLIAGHAIAMQSPRNHRWISDISRQLGPLFYIRLAHNHVLFVLDPTLVPILFDRALYPPNGNILDRPVQEFMVQIDALTSDSGHPNLFTAKTGDPQWRLVRKGVAPAFNPQNIRQGFVHVLEAVDQLIRVLKKRGSERAVDMDDAAQRVSLEVIGKVGFGKTFNALQSLDHPAEGDVFKVVALGLKEVFKRLSNPLWKYMLWDQEVRQGNAAFRTFHKVIRNLLQEVQARGPPSADDPTIGGHLMRLRDEKGQPLSDDRLHAEFSIMFIGGTDTSGHTIANTLFLVSQHPEVERKIEAELDSLGFLVTSMRKIPQRLEHADLSKLPYLSGVIKESMRMMAVGGTGVSRLVTEQMQLGPHTIPKGTILWAPIQAIHSSPDLWDKPDSFMPERWAEEDAEYWRGPTEGPGPGGETKEVVRGRRYLPFGDGMRSCVGQSLAKMNYTATLALLLSHFSFRLADRMGGAAGVMAAEVASVTVAPKDGMWMHAVPRG